MPHTPVAPSPLPGRLHLQLFPDLKARRMLTTTDDVEIATQSRGLPPHQVFRISTALHFWVCCLRLDGGGGGGGLLGLSLSVELWYPPRLVLEAGSGGGLKSKGLCPKMAFPFTKLIFLKRNSLTTRGWRGPEGWGGGRGDPSPYLFLI